MQHSSDDRPPANFQTVRLTAGAHSDPHDGTCVMELASMLAGEPFTDQPLAVCPVIGVLLRAYNDLASDTHRQDLYGCAALVVGSRDTHEIEERRAEHCLSWAQARRRESPLLRRLLQRRARPRGDVRRVFISNLLPLLRRADEVRHQQVLNLVDELLEIRSGGGQGCEVPAPPREPLAPALSH